MTPAPTSSAPELSGPFQPPGPGSWSLDTAHFPRPATRFVIELFSEAATRGFSEATAGYGLLLDHIEWGFVRRWAYLCPRPVPALGEHREPLTREGWERLVSATPALGDRLAKSANVFEDRRWHEDVRRWDEQVKPALRSGHRELQAIDPWDLDGGELISHLAACRENLRRAIYHHHRLNVAPVIAAGDFLAHVQEWTGHPLGELVSLLRGPGPQTGGASAELTRLAEALAGDPVAAQVLREATPDGGLGSLLAQPGKLGAAAAEYVDLVGNWTVGSGSDVGDPRLTELPHVLLETIRAATDGTSGGAVIDACAEVRAGVGQGRRRIFDELLAEARASHRLRDERATYCDGWAYGLARRAILAAGTRLAEAGAIEQPDHLVEAGYVEMRSLLGGGAGPSGELLAARAAYRAHAAEDQAPAMLGGPPRVPVPTPWLPAGAARTERAFRTYVAAMSGEVPGQGTPASVAGQAASAGAYEGRARVIRNAGELERIEQGDVLVTGSTSPAINVVLPLVGAIVTDRGGLLSHAAIVAREFGIPAVVGTGKGTARIPDGAFVRVDGAAGKVTVLGYDPPP